MFDFRTDLADERTNIIANQNFNKKDIDGIKSETKNISQNLKINVVTVLNQEGSKKIDKKIGIYTTIDIKDIEVITKEELEQASQTLTEELKKLIKPKGSVLIIGLGNADTTADSIGPKIIKDLEITRHLIKYKPELLPKGIREISAISPGVLGNTGIETEEIIKAVVEKINPSMLIVIDALMSTNISRLLRTIQISNTGITPGAGVGNKRKSINEEGIGIPVISIGVPTIVDAATIVANSADIMIKKINKLIDNEKYSQEKVENNKAKSSNKSNTKNKESQKESELKKILNEITETSYEDKYRLIKDVLEPAKYNLAVMPKEIDKLVDNMKCIIAHGINDALN